jgi:magnesium-transporting ATPase (P-type)
MGLALNILVVVVVVVVLTVGAAYAWRRVFETHRRVQTAGVALSLVVALVTMLLPNIFGFSIAGMGSAPGHPQWLVDVHVALGLAAFLFGVFVGLRGNGLMIRPLRFRNYRPYMPTAYVLYLVEFAFGVVTRLA